MSANLKTTGNVTVSNYSFERSCNILAVASELILIVFGGILSSVDGLLRLMSLVSFTR